MKRLVLLIVATICLMGSSCPPSPLEQLLSGKKPNTDFLGPELLTDVPSGVIFTTPNYPNTTDEEFGQALNLATQTGEFLSYVWNWQEGDRGLVTAVQVVEVAKNRNLDMLLQFSPQSFGDVISPPGLEVRTFTDPALQERYINDVVKLASLKPRWLVLATEIDLLLRANPDEYTAFTKLYQRAYPAVKQVAPDTMVGVSYHWGLMFAERHFDVVKKMGMQDFIGLTSYPDFLVLDGIYQFTRPNDIPLDYYNVIREAFPNQPIGFTELGWTTLDDPSMSMQAEYIARLPDFFKQVRPIFCSWAMLYDANAFDASGIPEVQRQVIKLRFGIDPDVLFARLNHMGLSTSQGLPKPGLSAFLGAFKVTSEDMP